MQNFRISAPGSGVPLTALDNIIPFAGKRESGRNCLFLALFCRANRAEQCRLSGADRPTYAQCEFFAF
jgi:hypothetical protein